MKLKNKAVVYAQDVVIPTYEIGKPDRNPMFLEKRVYQGSTGKIYPYPTTQDISREKKDKVWKAVILENEYLKVMVLPELGGRIQRAYDKTNGYDFVYYNQVIKPALVGLLGPWISGGIEFNWPQHHRPTTYMPVDWKMQEEADGTVSVLLGDTDRINGTKVITTISLEPGKAYIRITGQLYNRTSLPQTFLWWANPAVSVNDDTQSVFPPDVHFVYDHGRRAVSRFPIATGEYYKHDYSEGVDISRYKNIPVPTSYMAEKSDFDFVGGYDYGKQAGLLHVADHHISPGKKQWTWGNGGFGRAWDRNLTDEDGPYIELMTGMYCDNQPDFTYLAPFEEKVFNQYFMPYKHAGYVKNASIHAAVNAEQREDGLWVCVYATERFEDALVEVLRDGQPVWQEKTSLSPTEIFEKTLPLPEAGETGYAVRVSAAGKELISWRPLKQEIPRRAEPAKALGDPALIQTTEELLLAGEHIEQYRHATFLPDPYYLEGLKRDPGNIQLNNAYGMLLLRRGRFDLAEKYFRKALERLTALHPNPRNGETFSHLGLSLFYQRKLEVAFDAFYKAIWCNSEEEMGYYFLGAISARRGRWADALAFADKGLVKNQHNVKVRGLKAACLLKLGKDEEAEKLIEENLSLDEFDMVSRFLPTLFQGEIAELQKICAVSHRPNEAALRAAGDLMEVGLNEEAVRVLDAYAAFMEAEGREAVSPMLYYYRSACLGGDAASVRRGEAADPYLCFPNRLEDIYVLEAAIRVCPDAAKAYYYLGNLYYDKLQYDLAIEAWEKSAALDDGFPTVLRNLAIAYYNKRGMKEEALRCLEKAFILDESDARVFLELDQLYKMLHRPFAERIANCEKHMELVEKRDDLYTEYVTLLNQDGRYAEAHEVIIRHRFGTWEGAEGKITTQFKLCLLEMAKKALAVGDARAAKQHLEEALSYPENLGEGRLEGTRDNHLYYTLGEALEALGEEEKAKECYRLATLGAQEPAGMMYYYDQPADMILYQGLSWKKLGENGKANACFYRLLDYGESHLWDEFKMDYFAVSMPDFAIFEEDMTEKNRAHCLYLCGLGKLGLGRRSEAEADFRAALAVEPAHQMAGLYLKYCEKEGKEA